MNICKGICERMPGARSRVLSYHYKQGFKTCSVCCCGFKTEDKYCPCCRTIMRVGIRKSTARHSHAYYLKNKLEKLISSTRVIKGDEGASVQARNPA